MSGQVHLPAALPTTEKTPGMYCAKCCMGTRACLEAWRREKSLRLLRFEPRIWTDFESLDDDMFSGQYDKDDVDLYVYEVLDCR